MALLSPRLDERREASAGLEPELHEGDGRIPTWIWFVVGAVILFAVLFAPFQLFWPIG